MSGASGCRKLKAKGNGGEQVNANEFYFFHEHPREASWGWERIERGHGRRGKGPGAADSLSKRS